MDILFPWRKSFQSQQSSDPSQSRGENVGYHSLPHPEEHSHHYGGVASAPPDGTPSPLQMMMASYGSGMSGGVNNSSDGTSNYDTASRGYETSQRSLSASGVGTSSAASSSGMSARADPTSAPDPPQPKQPGDMTYSQLLMGGLNNSVGTATRKFLGSDTSSSGWGGTSDASSVPSYSSGIGRGRFAKIRQSYNLNTSYRSSSSRSLGTYGTYGGGPVGGAGRAQQQQSNYTSLAALDESKEMHTMEESNANLFHDSESHFQDAKAERYHDSQIQIDAAGTVERGGGEIGMGEDGGGGRPKFRAPLDQSNRSQTSDISERSGGIRGGAALPPPQSQMYQQQQQPQPQEQGQMQMQHDYYNQQGAEPGLIPVEENSEYFESNPSNSAMETPSGPSRRSLLSFSTLSNGGGGGSFRGGSFPGGSFRQQYANSSAMGSSSYIQQSSRTLESATESEAWQEDEEDVPVSPLRQLLDAINMSILPASLRLSSLAQAVEFFDHRDRAMHDAELREGGAFVLYHKLGLVLRMSKCGEAAIEEMSDNTKKGLGGNGPTNHYLSYQQSLANSLAVQQQTEFDKEIAMVCSCLEMVHRANPDAIAQTWDECGNEILPLLVHVLERPFQKIERAVWMALQQEKAAAAVPGSLERAVATAVTRDQKLAVQKVTKVLAMYSLVPEAKGPMCEQGGMLRWLTRIIDTHNYNRVRPGAPAFGGGPGIMSGGGGGPTGGLMGLNDDGSEGASEAKRLELANRATSGSGLYMTEAARFNTIATLTNLAALETNRMSMLREPGLLDNVCRAVHNERSDVPKQCSALAIMNLSNGDMDHVPEMARNDLVLETLLKLMKEDNPETRRNAVVTIFNIACSDQNTVRLARYRDGTVLEALVELVGSDDPSLRTHDEARANAAETIFNMSCSEISETTDRMANHAGLLECLAVTLRGEHTGLEVKMYCSATLRRMAELISHPMIAQGALLSALVKAATWTSTDCIAEAFRAQASIPENCVIMAHHHGLLNALSRLALTRGDGQDVEKVRMASCLAIELMSRHDEARALLSQNEGIIMALTKASYGDDQGPNADMRMSGVSELEDSDMGGFMDTSGRSSGIVNQDDKEGREPEEDDEDESMQSRRIQVALKNLVSAM